MVTKKLLHPKYLALRLILLILSIGLLLLSQFISATQVPVRNQHAELYSKAGIKTELLDLSLKAYYEAARRGCTDSAMLTVVDFSLPSSEKRLWVLDLAKNRVLFHEFVAHGRNSGHLIPTKFSNKENTYQSSIGLYQTGEVYHGQHGLSLRLYGLEAHFNSNAYQRAIVIHGANYVNKRHIEKHGMIGRSHGCLALDQAIVRHVIAQIKEGSLIFAYYPDQNWLKNSSFIH